MLESIGQHFVIGINGHSLADDEIKFIIENNIGGVILFSRNCDNPEQLKKLCFEIQSLSKWQKSKLPIFISIDMEGGRVHRLKKNFPQWPALKTLGDADNFEKTFQFAQSMGSELHSLGINLDYAPCLDIFSNPQNTVIGDRSFGTNAEIVVRHTGPIIKGYRSAKIFTCGKHFPGHGHTLIDSHIDLPKSDLSLNQLTQHELKPFVEAIQNQVDLMMIAHIHFHEIDPLHPATFSKRIVSDLLKEQLHFKGLVTSDDLDMGALSNYYSVEEIPIKAIEAGIEQLLYCNKPESPRSAIKAVENHAQKNSDFAQTLENNFKKIAQFKNALNS